MNGAMVVTWGSVVRGREAKALEVFQGAQELWDAKAKEGKIHDHKSYFNLIGRAGGMTIISGTVEALSELQTSDEVRKLTWQAQLIVEDFESGLYIGGDEQSIMQAVGESVQTEQDMGYYNP